jgi:signal transduction histidine kinase
MHLAGLALEAFHLGRELGGPGAVPLEDGLELGVDHAGERVDHGSRHGLAELGQQGPLQPFLPVRGPVCTDRAVAGAPAEGSAVNVEIPIRRRDGQLRWVLMSVVPASGHLQAHYEATVIDTTEHKQAEELRSIARVANAAAHEINNPLTLIVARLAMLADEPSLTPEVRDRVAQARAAAERIRTIVIDMHHLTRGEPFEHSSPSLPEMIDFRESAGRPDTPPSPGSGVREPISAGASAAL